MSKKPQTNLPTNPKARKERPMARGLLDYFPDALAEIANVSFVGNQQHNPGEEMHWAREKSSDHADCILRHLAERGTMDTDGLPHSAKMAWRALALLQIEVEATQARQEFDVQTYLDLNGVHPPIYAGTPTKIVALDDYRSSLTAKVNRRVYIAGPMRGIEKLNFPAFDEACHLARVKGYTPISPADIDRAHNIHEDTPPESIAGPAAARVFAERDCKALIDLRGEDGDAIAMLPGWAQSTGARAEFFLAVWVGLKVLDATTMMPFSSAKINAFQVGTDDGHWALVCAAIKALAGGDNGK